MKILVIGAGPLPRENRGIANAAGLRTEQFVQELEKKHDVYLIALENTSDTERKTLSETRQNNRHFRHDVVSRNLFSLEKNIRENIVEYKADIVFGINTFPAYIASKATPKDTFFWADLNGWVMSEMQVQAWSMNSDSFLSRGHEMETSVLHRADKISTVSNSQKYACIGELASIGRLSKDNFRHNFIETIENACLPLREWEQKNEKMKKFRGKLFPKESTIFLWLGGFNAWADEKTLLRGIIEAMKKNESIHFVCTGDILPGIEEKKYPWFVEKAQKSEYAHRFHFLGWISADDIPFLIHESDVGMNVDLPCLETEIGARNRINEFMRYEKDIISTRGAEISTLVQEKNAGWICEPENADDLCEKILQCCEKNDEGKRKKRNAETLKNTRFSATITQSPVMKWVQNPQRAPDKGKAVDFHSKKNLFQAAIQYYKTRGLKAFVRKIFHTLQK